jgi:hypothetical protein
MICNCGSLFSAILAILLFNQASGQDAGAAPEGNNDDLYRLRKNKQNKIK